MSEVKTAEEQVQHIYQTLCMIDKTQPDKLMAAIQDIPTHYAFNVLAEAIRAQNIAQERK